MALTRSAQTSILTHSVGRARSVLVELLSMLRDIGFQRWVADAVEMTGIVLSEEGDPGAAALLLGAAHTLREFLGESASLVLSGHVDLCRAGADETLGEDGVLEWTGRGRALATDEALTFALGFSPARTRTIGSGQNRPEDLFSGSATARRRAQVGAFGVTFGPDGRYPVVTTGSTGSWSDGPRFA